MGSGCRCLLSRRMLCGILLSKVSIVCRLMDGMLKQALECRPGVHENLFPRGWIDFWRILHCQLGKGIEFVFG